MSFFSTLNPFVHDEEIQKADSPKIHVSKADGRWFIDSNDLLGNERFKKQREALGEFFAQTKAADRGK